jgi:hypothetical protein
VEDVWVDVRTIRAYDRAQFAVDSDLSEDGRIPKRLENGVPQLLLKVDVVDRAVAGSEAQDVVVEMFGLRSSRFAFAHHDHARGSSLAREAGALAEQRSFVDGERDERQSDRDEHGHQPRDADHQ